MKFASQLIRNNMPPEGTSVRMKAKIKHYNRLAADIQKSQDSLDAIRTERKRQAVEAEIAQAQAMLLQLDDEICANIQDNIKNADLNKKRAENLKKSKQPKADPPPTATKQPDSPPPAPAKPAETKGEDTPPPAPAPAKKTDAKEAEKVPAKEAEKESDSGFGIWGWLAAAVVVGIAVVTGINLNKK